MNNKQNLEYKILLKMIRKIKKKKWNKKINYSIHRNVEYQWRLFGAILPERKLKIKRVEYPRERSIERNSLKFTVKSLRNWRSGSRAFACRLSLRTNATGTRLSGSNVIHGDALARISH